MYATVRHIIETNHLRGCHYVEPFAGGAGIAVRLLLDGVVNEITINDYDIAIYSFWHSIVHDTADFIHLIERTPITINEWYRQKDIYTNTDMHTALELGFATFFLNRTNRSGILNAGPIGGFSQNGNYTVDCRFNKLRLTELIKKIAEQKDYINISNIDAKNLIDTFECKGSFFFIDPPYFNKGKKLYANYFEYSDHEELAQIIESALENTPWIITYDICDEIRNIYSNRIAETLLLKYSLQSKKKASEFMFYNKVVV